MTPQKQIKWGIWGIVAFSALAVVEIVLNLLPPVTSPGRWFLLGLPALGLASAVQNIYKGHKRRNLEDPPVTAAPDGSERR